MQGIPGVCAFWKSRVGCVFLAWTLVSSTLVSGAMGGTLVLHQHGIGRAHLHVLGYADDLLGAAYSSRFGHSPRTDSLIPSTSQHVRILAIIPAVSLFVTEPRGADSDATDLVAAGHCLPVCFAEPGTTPADGCSTILLAAWFGRATSDDIVLHNHTLLI